MLHLRGTTRAWRRPLAVGAALVAAAGMSVGFTLVASASGGESTTNVQFVNLATPFKLFTNHSFAANASFSAVVIGGSTKVPSDATTVELSVTASGTAAGYINVYPEGDSSGGSGQFMSWGAGGSQTQTIQENVGQADELTFANGTTASKATATITGYSTQVTDGDISGADGTTGQVLTNNGTGGVAWQTPTPTGEPATGALSGTGTGVPIASGSNTTVESLTLPAGSYYLSYDGSMANVTSGAASVSCQILSPEDETIDGSNVSVPAFDDETMALQGLDTITAGGTYIVQCNASVASAIKAGYGSFPTFDAIKVGSETSTDS
jgi:hypothetical protein